MTQQARLHRMRDATLKARRRSLGAVVASALLCLAILWMSFEQRRSMQHGREALEAMRTARADLAWGALDLAVGGPTAADDARQRLARIVQAVEAVERLDSAALPADSGGLVALPAVRQHLEALERSIRDRPLAAVPLAESTLMEAVSALDRQAAAVDAAMLAAINEATARADRSFGIALAATLVLLTALGIGIVAAERRQLAVLRDWSEAGNEMEAVFNSLPGLVWFKDHSNHIRRVNAAAAAAAGRRVEDIEGRPMDDAFPLAEPHHVAEDRAVLESGVPSLGVLEQLPMPAGQRRWYRIDRVPYGGSDGVTRGLLMVARDVTELKATDDALLEERNRLAALAAAVPTVICSFRVAPDGSWSMPYASPRIDEIYGVSPAHIAADAAIVLARCHPEDRARLAASVDASRVALTPWHEEFRVVHPTKGEIWVEGQAVPFADPDGGVTWHGALTDATERRHIQEELQHREELLEQAGHIAHIGGWEFDPETGQGRWTAEVARIHDLDPSVPPSVQFGLSFYPEEARAQIEAAIAGAKAGVPYDVEVPFVSATGARKWVRTSGRPVMRDGKVVRVRGALHDITDRKEAEAAILERLAIEQRLSMLAAMSPAVMYTFRLGPDGAMSFPYASERFGELFGVPPTELSASAQPALSRIHPDDLPRVMASIRRSAAKGAPWIEELRFLHPTRGTVWVDGRSTPTRQPDGSTLWYGTLLDVTDRHQLEAELRQAQKLEAIGRLAGGVAHDFNNLLTVILGNASELFDRGEGGEELKEIVNASERAANLTRQLLLFSRKQVMQPVDLDLNTVLGDLMRMLQRILGEDVTLRADFAPRLPMVHADRGMMEQLLLNLAVNSRDAMPHGGELQVATRFSAAAVADPHRPADLAAGDYACITVHDTGTGIPPETLPRIFEPFFTTKEPGKGTGLGLATVYGIVKQHDGGIAVESSVGEGATFHVYLPVVASSVETGTVESKTAAPAGGRAECVMVVEDEAPVRTLAARVLERAGYRVVTAASGAEALQVWDAHEGDIALVVTDLVMPGGMSGFDLAERLAARKPDVRLVFTSGYSVELSSGSASLDPAVDFLQKPYAVGQLLSMVRRRLDSTAPSPPRQSS